MDRLLQPCLAALMLFGASLAPALGQDAGVDANDDASAIISHDETVTVSERIKTHADVRVGTAATVLRPDDAVEPPSSVADLVVASAGVAANGQGGLFQVVSIRGQSRHRVATSIDGARIYGDRRAGVDASFVDPLLLGTADVLRGSATVFHGTGAVGGIVALRTRRFTEPRYEAGWSSDGDENWQVAGVGGERWSAGLARRQMRDGETPDGVRRYSRYERLSAALQWNRRFGELRSRLVFVPSMTDEIGKPNTDFPERTTTYPDERHQLLSYTLSAPDRWRLGAFVHAHELETEILELDSRRQVFNESLDLGLRWSGSRSVGEATLRFGAELLGRAGVDAIEQRREPDPDAVAPDETLRTLDGAEAGELGGFAALRWEWGGIAWETGARLESARREDGRSLERSFSAWDGFVAADRTLGHGVHLRAALDSGVRFPNLSELFFNGTTARGGIRGNPDLSEERSLGAEVGLRWLGSRSLVGISLFGNRIDDYIELRRDPSDPDFRDYLNVTEGTIRGIELDGTVLPADDWSIGWAAHAMRGRADDGRRLADIPPDELRLNVTHTPGPWRWGAELLFRGAKSDPGDGELSVRSATVAGLSVGRRIAPGWRLSISAVNLFDETWLPSADDKALPAAGRSIGVRIVRFGG